MNHAFDRERSLISPPGDALLEHINFIEMTPVELAEKIDMSTDELKKIINGQGAITHDIARKLEVILGVPSNFWMNREKTYRRELSEVDKKEPLESQKCSTH